MAQPNELPGIFLAALTGLGLGVVLGPEAPLIALGGGLAVLAVKLARRDVPASTGAVIAATGSFAAISTLFENPLAAAFLLLEAPGWAVRWPPSCSSPACSARVSATWYSSAGTPGPDTGRSPRRYRTSPGPAPGCGAVRLGGGHRRRGGGGQLRDQVAGPVPAPARGAAAGAVHPAGRPGHRRAGDRVRRGNRETSSAVLFSGQAALTPLLEHAASYAAGALVLLMVCKGIAYAISLSSFRGGPTFPGMFIGAAAGIAQSHVPGLPMVAGAAIGIGAMTAGMLQLPMTAVLITTLILGTDGIKVLPLVIVAVVVSFVLSKWLAGPPTAAQVPESAQAAAPPQVR